MMPVLLTFILVELLNRLSSNAQPGIVTQKAIFKHPADQTTQKKMCDRKKFYFNIKAQF